MFELTEEHKILFSTIEKFAKEKIAPVSNKIDEEDEIPREIYMELRDMGLLGITIPQKYGGSEFDMKTYAGILEIVGKYSGGLALSLEAHNSLGLSHIFEFGNEVQRERFVQKIINSANPVAWGLTEPQAGSDAKNLLTTAKKEGKHYILNGSKIFITHGVLSDYIVIIAKTDNGITSFIVSGDSDGLTKSKIKGKLGMRGTDTAELNLDNVPVPAENMLGKEGDGYRQAMKILDGGRIAIAAISVGIAQAAVDSSLKYMKERSAFNKTLDNFEALQFSISELQTDIEAGRLLVYKAATLKDSGDSYRKTAAMAKYFTSKTAMKAADFAIQVHGGYGYFSEFGINRLLRDAKLLEIGEGTSEIQKLIIFRELTKD
ncbi:MAG: acyl-CoA dehydrogenase family protein [Candidatus Thermoplasmatota archaeon]|jgi:alkylation response protein AidB-like acyl-CoA dehydrogenase|nr:acyl-CoA dehydrogenase family protein [Candidatus Thermoplasmatota archaeon]MCL5964109.1 acyl-CoA dehydrogenase family protein [Candidatus Thermoplasmatota archaeon]